MKPEQIKRILDPIRNRLINLLTRAKVISVDSSQPVYIVLSTVRGKPKPEKIPLMQHFGFASVPPANSDQLRAHLSSDPDNPVSIASLDQTSQPTDLVEGDAALFDNRDQYIKIDENGIHINANTTVNINAATSVNVDSAITNLGVGGARIARLGDSVQVTVTAGSSAGTYSGTITSAGTNTSI